MLTVGVLGGAVARDVGPGMARSALLAVATTATASPALTAATQVAVVSAVAPSAPNAVAPAAAATAAPSAVPPGGTDLQGALIRASQRVGPAVVSVRTESGLGSGVLYDASGLLLTNAHVVDGAKELTIVLGDGRRFAGRLLGKDAGFDLAVVKIDGNSLPFAPLGNSAALQVGQFVVAIGNPFGLSHTVTNGVVSALNRPISEGQGSYNQPMIQTNADINPGNSGGPLIDLQGNVIGINTLVAAPRGIPAQGLGFAVPVDTAKRIAPQLVADGKVTRSGMPYLGVQLGSAVPGSQTPDGRGQPGQPQAPSGPETRRATERRAVIGKVETNGAAESAGLKAGDQIIRFNGRDIFEIDDLMAQLVQYKPGERIPLTVKRDGKELAVSLALGEAPARPSQG